jgi:flagellar biosynthesis/type III secretory pathway M-ring protein FliF/YscJ
MRFLRAYLDQIRKLLSGLTTTARMLVGALVVLVGVLLWGLIQYGGRPETVPVFKTPMAGEELVQAEQFLKSQDIPVQVKDGMLVVPAERQQEAMARLAFEGLAPAKAVAESTAADTSIWISESQANRTQHDNQEKRLSRLISMFRSEERRVGKEC